MTGLLRHARDSSTSLQKKRKNSRQLTSDESEDIRSELDYLAWALDLRGCEHVRTHVEKTVVGGFVLLFFSNNKNCTLCR